MFIFLWQTITFHERLKPIFYRKYFKRKTTPFLFFILVFISLNFTISLRGSYTLYTPYLAGKTTRLPLLILVYIFWNWIFAAEGPSIFTHSVHLRGHSADCSWDLPLTRKNKAARHLIQFFKRAFLQKKGHFLSKAPLKDFQ